MILLRRSILAVAYLTLLSALISCAALLPKIKYSLEKLHDTEQIVMYKNQCVSNLIYLSDKGDFIGHSEKDIKCKDLEKQVLYCYPADAQAAIEGLVKTTFEEYANE